MDYINQIIEIAIKKGLDVSKGIRMVNLNEKQDNFYINNSYICTIYTETKIDSGYNEIERKFYINSTITKIVIDKHAEM